MQFRDLKVGDKFRAYSEAIWTKVEHEDGRNSYSSTGYGFFNENVEVVEILPFRVACNWVMTWEETIYAETLQDAIDKVEDDASLIDTSKDGAYLDDSFDVNLEVTHELNGYEDPDVSKNQADASYLQTVENALSQQSDEEKFDHQADFE